MDKYCLYYNKQLHVTFKHLLDIEISDFEVNYREREMLYIRRSNPQYFNSILNQSELSRYFSRDDLVYPFVRLVKNGSLIKSDDYTHPNFNALTFNNIDKRKLLNHFSKGATIIIQQAHLQFNAIKELCKQISKDLSCETQANIYISPRDAKGFDPHIDTHDVLVFQIEGTKKWEIFDRPFDYPVGSTNLSQVQKALYLKSNNFPKIDLHKGDSLFIPRGLAHQAYSNEQMSVHITVGLLPKLLPEIVQKFSLSLLSKEASRKSIYHITKDSLLDELKNEFFAFLETVRIETEAKVRNLNFEGDLYSSLLKLSGDICQTDIFRITTNVYEVRQWLTHFELLSNEINIILPISAYPVIEIMKSQEYLRFLEVERIMGKNEAILVFSLLIGGGLLVTKEQ